MNNEKYQMVKRHISACWKEDTIQQLVDILDNHPEYVRTLRDAVGDFNIIEYRGYYTRVHYSHPDKVLYGKIEGIKDLVCFHCDNAKDAEASFKEAVDDYLSFCEDLGKEPNTPEDVELFRFSQSFRFEDAVRQILYSEGLLGEIG